MKRILRTFYFCSLLLFLAFSTILYAENRILNSQNGHYYQRFDKPMSWHNAVIFCNNLGAHLVTITSKDENLFVYENFDTKNENKCWIGATDENQEGKWEWVTGEEWKFTNWDDGEPNNSTAYDENGEDYIHLFWIIAENGTWNDIHGSSNFEYHNKNYFEVPICEWDKQFTFTDSDGDGVIDQWDSCPKTPENSCVNSKGCSCELTLIDEKGTVEKGKWKTYYVNLDKTYSDLIVKIQNLTDDVDLYVRKGSKPDLNNYDCRPYKGGKRDEICDLNNSSDTLWYFSIYGYKSADFSISVKAKRGTSNGDREWTSITNSSIVDWTTFIKLYGNTSYSIDNDFLSLKIEDATNSAIRANIKLPFYFTEIKGSWTLSSGNHADDNSSIENWGDRNSSGCNGIIAFGTSENIIKKGGEWGTDAGKHSEKTFSISNTNVIRTNTIRFENHQNCAGIDESITITDIELFVR